jgi:hypothetical protein
VTDGTDVSSCPPARPVSSHAKRHFALRPLSWTSRRNRRTRRDPRSYHRASTPIGDYRCQRRSGAWWGIDLLIWPSLTTGCIASCRGWGPGSGRLVVVAFQTGLATA